MPPHLLSEFYDDEESRESKATFDFLLHNGIIVHLDFDREISISDLKAVSMLSYLCL